MQDFEHQEDNEVRSLSELMLKFTTYSKIVRPQIDPLSPAA